MPPAVVDTSALLVPIESRLCEPCARALYDTQEGCDYKHEGCDYSEAR